MSSVLKVPDLMTVDEFLEWDSPGPWLWQLVDGVPVAMAPPSALHSIIQGEIAGRIWVHLSERNSACRVAITPGVAPRFQSNSNLLVPDIGVTCSTTDIADKALHEPVLLIEILSPSNHVETWRNVWAYMTIPSLREILVIRTASVGVDLLGRGDDGGWPDMPLAITDGGFTLASIDLSLPVAALYRGTGMTGTA